MCFVQRTTKAHPLCWTMGKEQTCFPLFKRRRVIIFRRKCIFCGNCKHVKFNLFELFYRPKRKLNIKCIPELSASVKSIDRFRVEQTHIKVHFDIFAITWTKAKVCTCAKTTAK